MTEYGSQHYVKLLGISISRSFKFDFHVLKVYSKANRNLTILSRMFKFLTLEKRKVLIKAYFEIYFQALHQLLYQIYSCKVVIIDTQSDFYFRGKYSLL